MDLFATMMENVVWASVQTIYARFDIYCNKNQKFLAYRI